jgi:hypothetical protein
MDFTYAVTAGKTSLILPVYLLDSSVTTGAALNGVLFGSITAYYWRSSAAAPVNINFSSSGTPGTYSANSFVQINAANMPGLYQACLPDAAYASGADFVTVSLKGAVNMVPWMRTIPLKAFNQDSAGVTVGPNGITSISIQDGAYTGAKFAPAGVAQGGASTSIVLDPTASAVNDYYQYQVVAISGGTGAEQSRLILSYNGGTKVATVDRAWAITPDATSEYIMSTQGPAYINGVSNAVTNVLRDAISDDIVEVQGNYTMQQVLSSIFAACCGRSSNGNTTFSTPNNAATRIFASVDSSNNRTAVTLTPST